jgi:hypothetical protein
MPSRSNDTRCFCIQCTREGGQDASGQPKGMLIASRRLAAHLTRVRAEEAEILARNTVEAQVVALTLTDCGPDLAGQPSKLWTSREQFQQEVNHNHHLPDHSTSPPINDILEGVSRLSIAVPSSNQPTYDMAPPVVHDPTSPPINDISAAASQLLPSSIQSDHNTALPIISALPDGASAQFPLHLQNRREKNRRTTKSLQVFEQIALEAEACKAKLTGMPTVNVIHEVQSTLSLLHARLAQVTRRTPLIDVRKGQISDQLISMDARVAEWKYHLNLTEPISYTSGKDLLSPF